MNFKAVRGVVAGMVLLAVAGCGSGAGQPTFAPGERLSIPPRELQGRWWSWAATEPDATNPLLDEDGRDCMRNQPRDIWFLGIALGDHPWRACAVPQGVPIAFPVVSTFGTREHCRSFMSSATGSVFLDNAPVHHERYPAMVITVVSAAGNPVTEEQEEQKVSKTFGCGLWVQLPPMEPGLHSLRIRGESSEYRTDVDYALTVGSPGK